jgi:phosphatidylserine/phosphatidylglycerophosphate/cardiolipin synthase-like enzyme
VKLIVQPDDGLAPIVEAVRRARTSVEMMIFRFDRHELEEALEDAVQRGVSVRTLIAHTNSEGERGLRSLEQRLLAAGATVARTADDLVRYHAKYVIVDGARLFVLGFNFTGLDTNRSRSFGLEVRSAELIEEARRLFEADSLKQPFETGSRVLVVSPVNARERLGAFIRKAKKELLIYDPKLSDSRMLALLRDRVRFGVRVRVIGSVGKAGAGIDTVPLAGPRLHVRAMVRDGARVFVGSQSLKRLELDSRRELGIVVHDRAIARRLVEVFERDWKRSRKEERGRAKKVPAKRARPGAAP